GFLPYRATVPPLAAPAYNAVNGSAATSLSYPNLTYTIKYGDTFYYVSTGHFQNLTSHHVPVRRNRQPNSATLIPTQLEIGDNVIFPIFAPVSKLPQLTQPIPSSPIPIGKKKKKKLGRGEEEVELGRVGKRFLRKETNLDFVADVSDCLDKYKVYEIEELREATDGFDEKWLIQDSVYKGCINGGFQAIKIQEDEVECL
ncbi:hypothetical protein U1Q18_047386, partial [Sarracenia purpurea var. burkii]